MADFCYSRLDFSLFASRFLRLRSISFVSSWRSIQNPTVSLAFSCHSVAQISRHPLLPPLAGLSCLGECVCVCLWAA